jgi:hypothetical protein
MHNKPARLAVRRRWTILSPRTWRPGRRRGPAVWRIVRQWMAGHRLRTWVVVLLLVLLGVWVVPAVRPGQWHAAGPVCPLPVELIVQTTPAMEATLRDLAQRFTAPTDGSGCRKARFTVSSVPSASRTAAALAADWAKEDLVLGPKPAVWIPDDSVELDRVRLLPGGDTLQSLGSVASSPVVLAMREAAAARLGQPRRSVPWRTMLGWARPVSGGQRLRLVRPDPTSSTVGLLATGGFYAAASGTMTGRRALLTGHREASRWFHDVEQVLETTGDELAGLCAPVRASGGQRAPDALLIAEQTMVAHNRDELGQPCARRPPGSQDRLVAFYAADGTPVLDHPYVLLPAAAATPARERLAREFFQYLRSTAQAELLAAGFRNDRGRTAASDGSDGVLRSEPLVTLARPDAATVSALTVAWQRARKPVRALIAVDVSGSMSTPYAGEGGQRITAARSATGAAVRLVGGRDQIGLWQFSQDLDGPRDYDELVRLGPALERRSQVQARLRTLEPTHRDTGLYATLDAGVAYLRAGGPRREAVNALVVLTDGKDSGRSGVRLDAVRDRLDTGEPVLIFMVIFGSDHCDTGELANLTAQTGPEFQCLDAGRLGLRQAFERVAAELWGTRAVANEG